MFRKFWTGVGALAIGAGLLLAASPAQAQEVAVEPAVTVEITEESCGLTVKWHNQTPWHFWGDYARTGDVGQVDAALPPLPQDEADYGDAHDHGVSKNAKIGDGPLAGKKWGKQYNPFHLPPGGQKTIHIKVSEIANVSAGVRRGAERDLYSWTKVKRVKPCASPEVEFEDTCNSIRAHLSNGEDADATARFFLTPTPEGTGVLVLLDAGVSEALTWPNGTEVEIIEETTGQVSTHTWLEPKDCGKTPAPEPTETCVDINEASAEELTDLKGVDDEIAARIVAARPFSSFNDLDRVQGLKAGGPVLEGLVNGGDGWSVPCAIGGTGGGLPNTSGLNGLLVFGVGGAALLGLGGGLYLVARKRRYVLVS